jgi:TRAP-type C4-dicarboxylate transport system permease small subunit
MTGFLRAIDRVLGPLMRAVAILCLVALLLILLGNVIARDFHLYATAWLDEVVEMLFAWMVFIGAAALWREGEHFRIDTFENLLAGNGRRALELVIALIGLGFVLVMGWQGWQLTRKSAALTPILELPTWLSYVCIPIAGLVMAGYSIIYIARIVRGSGADTPGGQPAGGMSDDAGPTQPWPPTGTGIMQVMSADPDGYKLGALTYDSVITMPWHGLRPSYGLDRLALFVSAVLLIPLTLFLLGPYCVRIVAIRKAILHAGIAIVALVGAYAATYSIFQMALAIVFGVIAYFLRKQGYPSVSLLLGFILGADLEQFFRRSLSLNDGNPMVFLTSPDSLFFLGLTAVFIWFMVIRPPRVVARLPEEVGS